MNFATLIYINRSGSTFLASELAKRGVVGSTIESKFYSSIIENFPIICDVEQLDKALSVMYKEEKFCYWGIKREELKANIQSIGYPVKADDVFSVVMESYFAGKNYCIGLYKCSRLAIHWRELLQGNPETKFIHIIRDPRAVYNSQKKAKVSNRTWRMADDPVSFARKWAAYTAMVHDIPSASIIEVRYEDLIVAAEQTLSKVEKFLLGQTDASRVDVLPEGGTIINYDHEIPEAQKALHKNLGQQPLESRLNAWQKETSRIECALIENTIYDEMVVRGYGNYLHPVSRFDKFKMFLVRLRFFVNRWYIIARKTLWFVSNPNALVQRIKERSYERK